MTVGLHLLQGFGHGLGRNVVDVHHAHHGQALQVLTLSVARAVAAGRDHAAGGLQLGCQLVVAFSTCLTAVHSIAVHQVGAGRHQLQEFGPRQDFGLLGTECFEKLWR